jgi:hypothetical protein
VLRDQLTPVTHALLELGLVPATVPHRTERFFVTEATLAHAWREHRTALMATWIPAHPGRRPAGWWRYDAMEPRRVLLGASLLEAGPAAYLEGIWRRNAGIPAARRIASIEDSRLVVESEAAYLRRLRLLTREERRALDSAAFAPMELALLRPTV